jgi:hypothetical protein
VGDGAVVVGLGAVAVGDVIGAVTGGVVVVDGVQEMTEVNINAITTRAETRTNNLFILLSFSFFLNRMVAYPDASNLQ